MQTVSPSTVQQFEKHMAASQLRVTNVRRRIFSVLYTSSRPLKIQEIIDQIDEGHFVSVYRSMHELQKARLIRQVPHGFDTYYELSDIFQPHHHHATCETCGATIDIHTEEMEQMLKRIYKSAGLQPTKHHLELFGICKNCQIA